MKSFQQLMANQVLLPIVHADSAEQGVAIAKAMKAAGIHLVEVVLRTPESLAALKAVKQAFPEMLVGTGTVTTAEILEQALEAGSDFIITPAISAKLVEKLAECEVPVLPGVSTVADILLAKEHGFTELKLFPASLSGGYKFIAAMASLFPDTIFCPTGGVNQNNKSDYLALANCFAVGGTWVAQSDWIKHGKWQNITEACHLANQE